MRRFLPSALLLSLLLASPAAGADTPAAGPGDDWHNFFPVTENSSWVYRFTNHLNGSLSRVRARVGKGQKIAGLKMKDARIFEERRSGSRDPVVYFEDEQGYLVRFVEASYGAADILVLPPKFGTGVQILPPNVAVGFEWQQDAVLVGRVRWTHTVAAHETVTVPAGVFRNCYRIDATIVPATDGPVAEMMTKLNMFKYRYSDWYADGVGIVKSVTLEVDTGNPVITEELESFLVIRPESKAITLDHDVL